jgi:hypothetical protein
MWHSDGGGILRSPKIAGTPKIVARAFFPQLCNCCFVPAFCNKPLTVSESENPAASEIHSEVDRPSNIAGNGIREGSPFAVDPEPSPSDEEFGQVPLTAEAFYDIGPMRYMALGAVLAAAIVLLFAAASAYWFPGGGLLVAGLGCLLAMLGFFSPRPRTAVGLLAGHLALLATAYIRMLG